jgi:hypothetical protein
VTTVTSGNEPKERGKDTAKHQAIFSIDYGTWQDLIQAYNITNPMIEHRDDGQAAPAMGARGWYN